jgi:hypothetical protein
MILPSPKPKRKIGGMKAILLLLALCLPPACRGQDAAKPADLTTLSGKTYKQARVFRVEPDGINYMFAGGIVKIPFTDLPEAVRKQYGYDPKQAASFAQAEDAAQARTAAQTAGFVDPDLQNKQLAQIGAATNQQLRDDEAAKQRKLASIAGGIARNAMYIRATVIQVLDAGVSVSYRIRIGQSGWPEEDQAEPIYIAGLEKNLADNETWEGPVFPFGRFHYEGKTVRGYALDAGDAASLSEAAK